MDKLERVRLLLQSQSTLALATVDAGGAPRSTPLFFISDQELCLFWFSSANSLHSRNCTVRPQTAVTLFRPTTNWRQICGVQMQGSVRLVKEPALRERMTAGYIARFELGPLPRMALRRSSLYCFTPAWVRYIDNSIRFGYRFELSL